MSCGVLGKSLHLCEPRLPTLWSASRESREITCAAQVMPGTIKCLCHVQPLYSALVSIYINFCYPLVEKLFRVPISLWERRVVTWCSRPFTVPVWPTFLPHLPLHLIVIPRPKQATSVPSVGLGHSLSSSRMLSSHLLESATSEAHPKCPFFPGPQAGKIPSSSDTVSLCGHRCSERPPLVKPLLSARRPAGGHLPTVSSRGLSVPMQPWCHFLLSQGLTY